MPPVHASLLPQSNAMPTHGEFENKILSSFNNTLAGQKLGDHEMANVFIGPVGEMAGDACPKGDIEEAPSDEKCQSVGNSGHRNRSLSG